MKKALKIFGVLVALFIVVGLLLDNKIEVSREIVIDASREQIFPLVNDLNAWPQWSPWKQLDPSIKTYIGDISKGVGASQSWNGEGGNGSLIFTDSSLEKGIVYDLMFDGDPGVYISRMQFQPEGTQTRVRWVMSGEMQPIIIGNYFALLMDTLVGDSFMLGLNNLKSVTEAAQARPVIESDE